jgi:hypothetical protein
VGQPSGRCLSSPESIAVNDLFTLGSGLFDAKKAPGQALVEAGGLCGGNKEMIFEEKQAF